MLLELKRVRKSFRDMKVIRGIDLKVDEREFVGVIGPNGAGKTTLFSLVSGALRCDDGAVLLDGVDVTSQAAHQRCRRGIGRTFQVPLPFQAMTVYENALVGATFGGTGRVSDAGYAAREAIETCGLAAVADRPAATLTLLQRKRLELARAMATKPRLLLLDEVGGGLTDAEMHELLALVVQLHRTGVTVVWIEHIVHALVSVVQRLVVLADGSVLADGMPADVIASPLVRQTYLGDELDLQTEVA